MKGCTIKVRRYLKGKEMLSSQLDPRVHCNDALLLEMRHCGSCKREYVLGDGIVYQTYYTLNGTQSFGWLPFCSLICLMRKILTIGEC